MKVNENKEAGNAPKTITTEKDKTKQIDVNSLTEEDTTKEASDAHSKSSFLKEIWDDNREFFKELFEHTIRFAFLIGLLSLFNFIIPLLGLPKEKEESIKNLDFLGIYIAIVIFTVVFLYKIIKQIIEKNQELKSVGSWLPFSKPVRAEIEKSDYDTSESKFSLKAVLNRISDFLILAGVALTLFFAVSDNWFYGFSIPIVVSIKGILIMADKVLPNV